MRKNIVPSQGEIFTLREDKKKRERWAWHYRPSMKLKTASLLTITAGLFFFVGTVMPDVQSSQKQYAAPLIEKYAQNDENSTTHRSLDSYNGYYGYTPMPEIRYIETKPTYPDYSNNPIPNTSDTNATSQQIVSTQQQMAQVMQSCSQNARQMQSQILNLRRQQDALNKQKDDLWNKSWQIDGSTPEGERQRQAIDNQARQLEQRSQQYDEHIRRAEEQFNTNKDRCWQSIDQLNQRREELEGRLHEQFGKNMDLPLWINQ